LDDKEEARADGGRRFQREGPASEKDLDLVIVVLVWGTKSSRLSRERTKDEEMIAWSAYERSRSLCLNNALHACMYNVSSRII